MKVVVDLIRKLINCKYALLGLAVIEDIPTDQFTAIVKEHGETGWKKTYLYQGFDAWIDYGRIDLQKNGSKLRFEWDNWTEGEISGPKAVVDALAARHGLLACRRKHWGPSKKN
jgi:hypothetical protein